MMILKAVMVRHIVRVHAFQIDTDGESITENKDGTQIKTAHVSVEEMQ